MLNLNLILFQAVDGVFKIQGEPWMVPWTAETVLQVRFCHAIFFMVCDIGIDRID